MQRGGFAELFGEDEFLFPSVAECVAVQLGQGIGGCGIDGRDLGIRFAAHANPEPAEERTGKGSCAAQRGASAEEQGTRTDLADGSADRNTKPAVFLRNDSDRPGANVALAPEVWRFSEGDRSAAGADFVLVDIDRFKRVNDEMGHAAGDRLLQEVAKRIGSVMRRSDDLVRWGGEEFMLVCRTTDRANAALLCTRVLEAVRDLPFDVGNGVQVHKTCSIGWAPYPWVPGDTQMLSFDNVIELADKALYLAKREGRNRSYGLVPAPSATASEKSISIENLRDCPPELVQIV